MSTDGQPDREVKETERTECRRPSDDGNTLRPPTDIVRSQSMESEASSYLDAVSNLDDEDYDGEDDYGAVSDSADSAEISMHPQLYADMENLVLIYGEKAISYRLLEGIDEIDIELNIPVAFLDLETTEAWKVNREEPIVVRMHLCLSRYLESTCVPKIEVFQPTRKEHFGVGSQLRMILDNFLIQNWKDLGDQLETCICQQAQAKKSQSYPSDLSGKTNSNNAGIFAVDDESMSTIMGCGFSAEMARNALIITHGNANEATNLLLSNPESCTDISLNVAMDVEGVSSVVKKPPKPRRQQSHPPLLRQLKRMLPGFSRATSLVPSATDPSISSTGPPLEDLNLLPQSTLDGRNAKNIPSIAEGFLIQIFRYIRQRIPTLNEYCVVCDEPHVFQNGAMLKPAVCSRELCVFAFQTLGVMCDAADDIATGAEVVDLLISMTRAVSKHPRKAVIFDPFPTVVDPANPCELAFHPKNKDFAAIEKVIDCIPGMKTMSSMASSSLKKKLDETNTLVYPLLQWIITSNRSHIVKLPPDRQLEFMHTPHQFLLMSSPPAKEATFRAAKVKYGSTFAFHGSSIENWHSIIRQGLLNASGTKFQVNGAAYGKGIYLSPQIATSMGYSRMGYGSRNIKKTTADGDGKLRFLTSNNINCIAICEVITAPNLKKNNAIWVCPDADHVCTRFFFVYEDGQVGDSSIDTQKDTYLKLLKDACGYKM